MEKLDRIGTEERQIDGQENQQQRQRNPQRPVPQLSHQHEGQDGVDGHGACDGDAVSPREIAGRFETEHQADHGGQQHPVDPGHVNLPDFAFGGMRDLEPRTIAELDRLSGQGIGSRDHRLRGNDCGHGGEDHHRVQSPFRGHVVERILYRVLVVQDQCALSKIIQQKGRQHVDKPGEPNRFLAEMSHVRIQRFGPGDGQHDGAEYEKTAGGIFSEEIDGITRREGGEDVRVLDDVDDAQQRQHREPDNGDRPEQRPDHFRALLLEQEQADQHQNGERNDEGLQSRCCDFQAFHCGQHRDRRRDDAVSVEQRGAEQAERHQNHAPARVARGGSQDQCEQGHDAALAAIVRAHHEHHVLQRHDDDQRPGNQRQHAEHVVVIGRDRMAAVERLAHRVQRAGADVAEHHADRRDRHRQYALLLAFVAVGDHCYFLFLNVSRNAARRRSSVSFRSSDKTDDATRYGVVTRLWRRVFGYHREKCRAGLAAGCCCGATFYTRSKP